ncbi:MAG: 1-acyl-sn-glycerol-3-phosphate acyltransferase [bacterium]|nr:1-acyl-sn-glycerol-3-phosphate acyltransferase [bacterium]
MKRIKFFCKIVFIGILILLFLFTSFLIFLFPGRNRRKHIVANCSYFCRLALKLLGINIRINSNFSPGGKTYLIVSNHVSYLDVLLIASILPASFITSVEISKDIFLGTLAKFGGSIFVERRKKTRLMRDLESVSKVLKDGVSVVLFPEGTSTNGETILPFKKTLFRSALYCGVEILPVCIRYISIEGAPVNRGNRDLIFWYGDMKFFPHFVHLLKLQTIKAEINILPAISSLSIKSDTAAKLAYKSIYETYQKFYSW